MRIVGTIWFPVAVMVLLVWVLAIAVFLSDGFDVGTIFMSVLMLAGAAITLFSAGLAEYLRGNRSWLVGIWERCDAVAVYYRGQGHGDAVHLA